MTEELSPGSRPLTDKSTTDQMHRFTYDFSDRQSVAVSVIRAVAAVADVDPLSLRPRLYDVLDPDALEKLVGKAAPESDVKIVFTLGLYEVTVTRRGTICVLDCSTDRAVDDTS